MRLAYQLLLKSPLLTLLPGSATCCNHLVDAVLNMWYTKNVMRAENSKHMYVASTSNNRAIMVYDLHCSLLLRCEALCACWLCCPIATISMIIDISKVIVTLAKCNFSSEGKSTDPFYWWKLTDEALIELIFSLPITDAHIFALLKPQLNDTTMHIEPAHKKMGISCK